MLIKNWKKAFADEVREYLLDIKIPKGSKVLYIGENTDYGVNEYELLLSNKTKYRILKIKNDKIIL